MENESFKVSFLKFCRCIYGFFLEISNVFMMSAFIAALDKKAKDIRINPPLHSLFQLVGLVGGNEFIHVLAESFLNSTETCCADYVPAGKQEPGPVPFQWRIGGDVGTEI